MQISTHFSKKELECPCCGYCEIDKEFIGKLEIVRLQFGYPMVVTSGCRCEDYNEKKSSNSQGDHTRGLAVDVSLKDRYKRAKLLKLALNIRYFKDIAIGKDFIHLGRGKEMQGLGIYG